jgi:hypothetical protein
MRPGLFMVIVRTTQPRHPTIVRICVKRYQRLDNDADLLAAAKALLESREDQMVISAEWERLQLAVDAAR